MKRGTPWFVLAAVAAAVGALAARSATAAEAAQQAVGVVSHVKVLSDKVPDVSSVEAWKKSFLKDGMSDREKALAAWKSRVTFAYQDPPAREYLEAEGCVHDPIKVFNVYGYGMCCCASANVEALARAAGLKARGFGINLHSVPEVFWDGAWHLLDASLVNYFPKADGEIASLEEICAAVQGWLNEHPDLKGNNDKLVAYQRENGWTGWKGGPDLLARCPFYDGGGWWPARTHGWYSTMQEYNGAGKTPFIYEYGYSLGYQVNVQLRPGERLTRNWFHKGLHVNGVGGDGDAPGCLKEKIGSGSMAFLTQYGDLTRERVGSGVCEYDVPLADGGFRTAVLAAENLAAKADDQAGPAVHVKDPAKPGILEIDMPTSYVYLTGELAMNAVVGDGGKVRVFFSDSNGLDWREIAAVEASGEQKVDLGKHAFRRYDYRLRFVLQGKGTGLESLKIRHDVQCSQRALPTLGRGTNTITFSAGPHEGTVTIQGLASDTGKGKQVQLADFRPVLSGVAETFYRVEGEPATVTFPIATPGDMRRLRFGCQYRVRDQRDQWEMQVSFDGGKTFKTVETLAGPTPGECRYVTVADVPAGTRQAHVRWSGTQRNTTCVFAVRIDADYAQPRGGFRPVKVTYVWEEGGVEKKDVHVARKPEETYAITCAATPEMKSLIVELAD